MIFPRAEQFLTRGMTLRLFVDRDADRFESLGSIESIQLVFLTGICIICLFLKIIH